MNKIISRIFAKRVPDFKKLSGFGFQEISGGYFYRTEISDGQFKMRVSVIGDEISTEVTDGETGEEYSLFLVEDAVGSFVGAVRAEYERVLSEIAGKCFLKCVFKYEYTQAVIEYVRKKYGGELEFLWEKFDDNAVWRRRDNRKWYGAVLTVARDKFGFPSKEKVEVLDLRTDPERIDETVDGKRIFYGYHMNKRHWITIILDGSVGLDEIYKLIDESYILAAKSK